MNDFIWLLFAHYIGDYALQPHWIISNKRKYINVLIGHSFVWTACVSIALQYLGLFSLTDAAFLFVWHGIIDHYKMKLTKKGLADNIYVIGDQLLHIIQLYIVYAS